MRRNAKASSHTAESDLHRHLNDQVAEKKKIQLEELIVDKVAFVKYYKENGNEEAKGIVQEQVRRLEDELVQLGGRVRPAATLAISEKGSLPARFEPVKAEKQNSLFGASPASLPWVQPAAVVPPTSSDTKSTRDAVWEQKRQQFLNKQKGAAIPDPPVRNELDVLHELGDAKFGTRAVRRRQISSEVANVGNQPDATASISHAGQNELAPIPITGGALARNQAPTVPSGGLMNLGQDAASQQAQLKQQQQAEYSQYLAQQSATRSAPQGNATPEVGQNPAGAQIGRQTGSEDLRYQREEVGRWREDDRQRELVPVAHEGTKNTSNTGGGESGIMGLGSDRQAREQQLRQERQNEYRAHLASKNQGQHPGSNPNHQLPQQQVPQQQYPPHQPQMPQQQMPQQQPLQQQLPQQQQSHQPQAGMGGGIMNLGQDRAAHDQEVRKKQQEEYQQYLASQLPKRSAAETQFAAPLAGAQHHMGDDSAHARGGGAYQQSDQPRGFAPSAASRAQPCASDENRHPPPNEYATPYGNPQANAGGGNRAVRAPAPWDVEEKAPQQKVSYGEELKRQIADAQTFKAKRQAQAEQPEWWERQDAAVDQQEPPRRGRKIVQADTGDVKKILEQQIEEKRLTKVREREERLEEERGELATAQKPQNSARANREAPAPAASPKADAPIPRIFNGAPASAEAPRPTAAAQGRHCPAVDAHTRGAQIPLPAAGCHLSGQWARQDEASANTQDRRDAMLNVFLDQHSKAQEIAHVQQKQLLSQLQQANSQLQAQMDRLRTEKDDAVMGIVKLKEQHLDAKSKEVALLEEQLKRKILYNGIAEAPPPSQPMWSKYEPAYASPRQVDSTAPGAARQQTVTASLISNDLSCVGATCASPVAQSVTGAASCSLPSTSEVWGGQQPPNPLEQSLTSESKLIALLKDETWNPGSLRQALQGQLPLTGAGTGFGAELAIPASGKQPAAPDSRVPAFDPDRALADFNARACKPDSEPRLREERPRSGFSNTTADFGKAQKLDLLLSQPDNPDFAKGSDGRVVGPSVPSGNPGGQSQLAAAVRALRSVRDAESAAVSRAAETPCALQDSRRGAETYGANPLRCDRRAQYLPRDPPGGAAIAPAIPPTDSSSHAASSRPSGLALEVATRASADSVRDLAASARCASVSCLPPSCSSPLSLMIASKSFSTPTPVRAMQSWHTERDGQPDSPLAQMLASMKATASEATLRTEDFVLPDVSLGDTGSPKSPLERMVASLKLRQKSLCSSHPFTSSPLGRMLETMPTTERSVRLATDPYMDDPLEAPSPLAPASDMHVHNAFMDSLSYSFTGTLPSPLSRWARTDQLDELFPATTDKIGDQPGTSASATPDLPALHDALLNANNMNSDLRQELLDLCNPSLADLRRKRRRPKSADGLGADVRGAGVFSPHATFNGKHKL